MKMFSAFLMLLICTSMGLQAQDKLPSPSPQALKALGPELSALLQQADSMHIFRLRPIPEASGLRIGGYPVLQEVVLSKKSDLTIVRSAFFQEKTFGDYRADCFVPHHAVQLKIGERTLTLIVCFTCNQIRQLGKKVAPIPIRSTGPLRDVLETILKRDAQEG